MNNNHLKYRLLNIIKRIGGNFTSIFKILNLPSNAITKLYESLFIEDGLRIYPILETERIGLNKAIIWCRKSSIKYETAKKIMGPLTSIFRGDLEENKFLLTFYSSKEKYKEYKEEIEKLTRMINAECEIEYIDKYYRYINDESCFDFNNKTWICDNKITFVSYPHSSLTDLHRQDVDLLVTIQSNPFSPFLLSLHFNHIKQYLRGFIYTLGDLNYLVTSRGNYILSSPYLLWSVKLDDGNYVSEYHINKENLDKLTRELMDQDIIVAVKDLAFAHGFSIPYEVFKYNKWEMPRIVVES